MEIPGIVQNEFSWRNDDGLLETISLRFRQVSLRDQLRFQEQKIMEKFQQGDFEALLKALLSLLTKESREKVDRMRMIDQKEKPLGAERKLLYFCGDNPWQALRAWMVCQGMGYGEADQFIEANKESAEKLGDEAHKKKMTTVLRLLQ